MEILRVELNRFVSNIKTFFSNFYTINKVVLEVKVS